jgi:hypothetical protein
VKQISRHEAESLFDAANVVSTKVEHGEEGLRVSFQLKDDRSCVICYNSEKGQKQYYVDTVVV